MPDGSSHDSTPALTATPPVKCLGGKRKLAPVLMTHFPDAIHRYVEPFAGGAAVFFALYNAGRLRDADVVLSDTNEELIAMYRAIRDVPTRLLAYLREHEGRYRKERAKYYYAVRTQDPREWTEDAQIGARYIFLNKTCFNGVSRYNSSGKFNVPHGSFKSEPTICDASNILMCSHALARAELSCEDFKDVLARELEHHKKHRRQSHVVYADSPYIPLSKTSSFVNYGRDGFSKAQHEALADHLRQLAKAGVHAVASNSGCDRVRELYAEGFVIHEIKVARSINSKTDKRGAIKELIMVSEP